MSSVAQVSQLRNWTDIRNAYVERELQPSLEELAAEFGPSMQKISRVSVAESWPLARAARLEKSIANAETAVLLAHAVAGDRSIQETAKTAALGILRGLVQLGEELAEESASENTEGKKKRGDRQRAGTLNDMSFALANVSKTMRDLGITGVAAKLDGIGGKSAGSGKSGGAGAAWSPSMLSQINLTVQNLTSAPAGPLATVAPDAPARSSVVDADAVPPVPVPPSP